MSTPASHQFKVNLKAFIELLSDHLYSDPKVFVRELLQNGIDAITAREQYDPSFTRGKIELETVPGDADTPPQLILTDNGAGLTEEEVHQFLAQIASSSKREALSGQGYIGQFGIGLLACFMVSDEIVMITQSVKGGPALEWRGYVDGSYTVTVLESEQPVGTQVYLRARADRKRFFQPQQLRQLVQHFGSYLPMPIYYDSRRLNGQQAPWQQQFLSQGAARRQLLAYGEKQLQTRFLDAFPLESHDGRTKGVAFILPYPRQEGGKHWVYLKHMLLTTEAKALLPSWASFVQVVIDTEVLSPMASRETFREDQALISLRRELGKQVKNYLKRLAEEDRSRMERIFDVHGYTLAAVAIRDANLLDALAPSLPVTTTEGQMTLANVARQAQALRYVRTPAALEQVQRLTVDDPQLVVLAEGSMMLELLQAYQRLNPELSLEKVDISQLLAQTSEAVELDQAATNFLDIAEGALADTGLVPVLRGFEPPEMPVMLVDSGGMGLARDLKQEREKTGGALGGILDDLSAGLASEQAGELCFNAHNSLVQRLLDQSDEEVQGIYIQILYLQSLMANHHRLQAAELRTLEEALAQLLDKLAG